MKNFEIVIASLPDREKVVAEIYCGNSKSTRWRELSDFLAHCFDNAPASPDWSRTLSLESGFVSLMFS